MRSHFVAQRRGPIYGRRVRERIGFSQCATTESGSAPSTANGFLRFSNGYTLERNTPAPVLDSPSVRELSSGLVAASGWSRSPEKVQHSSSQFRPERRPGRKEANEYPRCRTTFRGVAGGRQPGRRVADPGGSERKSGPHQSQRGDKRRRGIGLPTPAGKIHRGLSPGNGSTGSEHA